MDKTVQGRTSGSDFLAADQEEEEEMSVGLAVRLQRNKDKLGRLKVRLREARRFHDRLLLEHGYFVPRDEYEEELASVEHGMVVVTKSRPEQRKLRKDSRLVVHWEAMKLKDRQEEHINTNQPDLHFGDGQINSVLYNLLHRETRNMSQLCSGAQTRQPAQDRELRCRMMTQAEDSFLRFGPFLLEEAGGQLIPTLWTLFS